MLENCVGLLLNLIWIKKYHAYQEKLQRTCINLSEISTSKRNKITHNMRTHLKGREFGLVINGAVLRLLCGSFEASIGSISLQSTGLPVCIQGKLRV